MSSTDSNFPPEQVCAIVREERAEWEANSRAIATQRDVACNELRDALAERDEARTDNGKMIADLMRLRGALLEIASGHPDPAGLARRVLRGNC